MKKKVVVSIIITLVITISIFSFVLVQNLISHTLEYDVVFEETDTKSRVKEILNEYIDDYNYDFDLLSFDLTIKEECIYVFFDFSPSKDSIILNGINYEEVKDRTIFYGYAKVEKKYSQYVVTDFQTSMYDKNMGNKNLTVSETSQGRNHICYGKILNSNVKKIEFYEDNFLIDTYLVDECDFYLADLTTDTLYGDVHLKLYDDKNILISGEY